MSTTSRTVQATPGVGPLVAIFAAAIAGTALIVALAYGQLTASQSLSVAPAAAPVPAVFDHGWSSSGVGTTRAINDHGWSSAAPSRPAIRGRAFDKSHHAVTRGSRLVRNGGSGGKSVRLAQ
jgi:hypothetical protein